MFFYQTADPSIIVNLTTRIQFLTPMNSTSFITLGLISNLEILEVIVKIALSLFSTLHLLFWNFNMPPYILLMTSPNWSAKKSQSVLSKFATNWGYVTYTLQFPWHIWVECITYGYGYLMQVLNSKELAYPYHLLT